MTQNISIRVLIADDHAVIREGLKHILASTKDMVLAGEAHNGLEAIKLARNKELDVMILDINMPDRNGIDVLKQVHKEKPELAILMFSMHPEEQYAIRALKAGAAGYLNKQCAPAEMINAIRQAASGQKYISPALAQELARGITEDLEKLPHESLSDREYQTLILIGSGKSTTDISKELALSVKTISEYRTRLLNKMNLKNSSELMHYAIKNKLVD